MGEFPGCAEGGVGACLGSLRTTGVGHTAQADSDLVTGHLTALVRSLGCRNQVSRTITHVPQAMSYSPIQGWEPESTCNPFHASSLF
jgi:hypothetical protein